MARNEARACARAGGRNSAGIEASWRAVFLARWCVSTGGACEREVGGQGGRTHPPREELLGREGHVLRVFDARAGAHAREGLVMQRRVGVVERVGRRGRVDLGRDGQGAVEGVRMREEQGGDGAVLSKGGNGQLGKGGSARGRQAQGRTRFAAASDSAAVVLHASLLSSTVLASGTLPFSSLVSTPFAAPVSVSVAPSRDTALSGSVPCPAPTPAPGLAAASCSLNRSNSSTSPCAPPPPSPPPAPVPASAPPGPVTAARSLTRRLHCCACSPNSCAPCLRLTPRGPSPSSSEAGAAASPSAGSPGPFELAPAAASSAAGASADGDAYVT
ncbi:hypothetical protein DMC30DRAFT_302248 [Rhodotorula diobovata]|uniref:Uncharacterized protein n=1 Tax=Rhodotorula diobovata TaxID=5288 RepID=A0A5C5FUQ1_9BASI|nr:hypothetical protein DMC30DRAFT_302248 [Rhodotorula diobovata]